MPETLVAHVDSADVYLIGASIANHLTVLLEGREPPGGRLAQEYAVAVREWAEAAQAGEVRQPPRWPADRLLQVEVFVTDDEGSAYQFSSAEAGGDDFPWRFVRHFRPPPPPTATTLSITFQSEDGFQQTIHLPLIT